MTEIVTENSFLATVVTATRRFVSLLDEHLTPIDAMMASSALNTVVGDMVSVEKRGEDFVVTEVHPRKNCLKRSTAQREKYLAANLDRLFIIVAPGPLFNLPYIHRLAAAAAAEDIPFSLVVNKSDLGLDAEEESLKILEDGLFHVIRVSALRGDGMAELRACFDDNGLKIAALAGNSGVGKSSILNFLISDASSRTGEVSGKTGQGRQTTTQSMAHIYDRGSAEPAFLIDLPGVQSFGLAHLTPDTLIKSFPEIGSLRLQCSYSNCSCSVEPECPVKQAVERGEVSQMRYECYRDILAEIAL